MSLQNNIKVLYVDLFCGAGGTSTGVENARYREQKCAKVIACVNHDKNAIASHAENHPETLHFTEDIRTLHLQPLIKYLTICRIKHPEAKVVLWASLECTNFSKAKGGQPRDADSRTLADHLFRYIEALNPDYVQIENVEEFMSWGELDKNGKPISRLAGTDYTRWVNQVKGYGYNFEHRILNSADYGAYTSRRRFFGQFAKVGLPIAWPKPTHEKSPKVGLFDSPLQKWKAVKDVLDFADEGTSIFAERKKPLSERTLERIYMGLIKFVAGGMPAFLAKYNSSDQRGNVSPNSCTSVDEPSHTIAVQPRMSLIQTQSFISKQFSGAPESKNISVEEPTGAITCVDHHALVNASFIQQRNSGKPESKVVSLEQPARTLTQTGGNMELVQPQFLSSYYGKGGVSGVDVPAPTVTTRDRFAKIQPCFLDMQYGNGTPANINEPAPTVTTNPKHQMVICTPWVMPTNFGNVGNSINEPATTITANRKWHYLVATKSGRVAILIYESDTPFTQKIKEFMALYGIADIKMRMLRIPELKQIMGFPKDYVLIGTQADQKKFIGNAVEVNMARVICEALVEEQAAMKVQSSKSRFFDKLFKL